MNSLSDCQRRCTLSSSCLALTFNPNSFQSCTLFTSRQYAIFRPSPAPAGLVSSIAICQGNVFNFGFCWFVFWHIEDSPSKTKMFVWHSLQNTCESLSSLLLLSFDVHYSQWHRTYFAACHHVITVWVFSDRTTATSWSWPRSSDHHNRGATSSHS